MRPAIVMKAKFITPETKSRKDYSSYINYINREEALHKSEGGAEYFSNYIDYMNDRQKGAFAFDDKKDKLNQSDTLNKEKIFDDARRDNRVLWQDVYSFDNSFLEEQGIYNSKTESLDSKTMIQSVRESMNHYKKTNKINNLVWTGAIHLSSFSSKSFN